jgi:hypothetical protein
MTARWLQAKKTKLRRAYLKRAKPMPAHGWAKPYRDSVNSIGRAAIADQKLKELLNLVNTRHKFIRLHPTEQSEVWKKIRVLEKYLQNNAFNPPVRGATQPMRERTEAIHKLWQGDRSQGLEAFNRIKIYAGKMSSMDMFWSGTKFFFLRKDLIKNIATRSVVYPSRERAMFAYEQGAIDWTEIMDLE